MKLHDGPSSRETDEDIKAIPTVAKRILDIGREKLVAGVTVFCFVAVFCAKSYTPVGWPEFLARPA